MERALADNGCTIGFDDASGLEYWREKASVISTGGFRGSMMITNAKFEQVTRKTHYHENQQHCQYQFVKSLHSAIHAKCGRDRAGIVR